MTYFQCLLIITTIWTAEVVTRFAFDYVTPHKFEYRTYYLEPEKDGTVKGAKLEHLGNEGWELIEVKDGPDNELICFFKKATML